MKRSQIGVQLYTLRDYAKTEKDLAETLSKVAAIGYEAVQVSGIGADIDPAAVKELCAQNKLSLCATHENSMKILDDTDAVIARMKAFGCDLTAYPFPAGVEFGSEESVRQLIDKLSVAGRKMAAEGITLTYHNHHQEFRKIGGKTILEMIYDEIPANELQGEPDTYWVQYGGGDPIAWCKKLDGRLPIIHLKDYKITEENKPAYCPIGAGNLNIPGIIAAAESAGCKWFVVEQDECPEGAFNAVEQSFKYLAGLVE
jgi:sugar phosphate isomerase/epimerase